MDVSAVKGLCYSFLKHFLSAVRKILFSIYYVTLAATIIGSILVFFAYQYLNSPGPLDSDINIVIKSGTSAIHIAKTLSDNKVIEHPEAFSLLARILPYGDKLKAGEYAFSPGITPYQAMQKIHSGKVVMRTLTVPEGLMTFQVLDIVKNNELLTGDVPENIGEGELLPQTYSYYYGEKRADVIDRMKKDMQDTLNELWEKRQADLPLENKEQALVLASIIEKETALAEERSRVAAVFVNRLKKGMLLQTDPSVIYAVTGGNQVLDRALTFKDLAIDSPYNTYKYPGLPPSPIANPGRASIEAALNPMDTKEIYFVADGTGGHIFSSTLKEHNANVHKWRKIEKEMNKK